MVDHAPTGIVTLVFTDIEDSCGFWEGSGPGASQALAAHNEIVREAAESSQGYEIETEGDSFFLAFNTATDAIHFAVEAQRQIDSYDWRGPLGDGGSVRIRIGIHTGEAQVSRRSDGRADYVGRTANRAARVAAAGHGGQILLSGAAHSLVHAELSPEISLRDLGSHRLKGVGEEHLWQVCHRGLETDFPPIRTLNPTKHNLPLPLTAFIGRESAILAWAAQLRQPSVRLLTLTGSGGIGKTRAAQELAESLVDDYEDGVWWIELAEARDGAYWESC